MTDEADPGISGGAFAAIDAKLTVFALANGMDLSKGPDYRRLEWFSDGLERAILIRPGNPDAFDLTVMSWPTGRSDEREETSADASVEVGRLPAALTEAIDAANALGPPP